MIACLVGGTALLVGFVFIESHMSGPMFRLDLFKNRQFAAANFAGLLSAISRGGVQLMLIILLQGIWLPLHGYSYDSTPFWSGIFLVPMLVGFVIMGPIGGRFSDKHGVKLFATLGMAISAASLIALSLLPFNFEFTEFAVILLDLWNWGGHVCLSQHGRDHECPSAPIPRRGFGHARHIAKRRADDEPCGIFHNSTGRAFSESARSDFYALSLMPVRPS